jgi:hypothetical protein
MVYASQGEVGYMTMSVKNVRKWRMEKAKGTAAAECVNSWAVQARCGDVYDGRRQSGTLARPTFPRVFLKSNRVDGGPKFALESSLAAHRSANEEGSEA